MKKRLIVSSIILALLLLIAGGAAGIASLVKGKVPDILVEQRNIYLSRPGPSGAIHRDVLYRNGLFNKQALDIYMPFETGTVHSRGIPAVVFIHGGSWMHGRKEDIRVIDRFLDKMRSQGWAVVSINYVTSPLRLLEGPSGNVRQALEWIHENADEYGIDPWNMGLYSVSAGSHLTMEAMVTSGDPGSLWRFWLSEYGPVDLVAMADGEAFDSSDRLGRFPNRYLRKHSPLLRVEGPFPPTAIVHGDMDRTVAVAQSERLAETLRVYGTPVSLSIIPGGDHGFFNMSQDDWIKMEDRFIPFMRKYFRD